METQRRICVQEGRGPQSEGRGNVNLSWEGEGRA